MTNEYFWLFLITIFSYLIITDSNVLRFFDLILKLASVQLRKIKWWLIHNPDTFWARYFMWRRAMRIAEELLNERKMERESKMSDHDRKTSE